MNDPERAHASPCGRDDARAPAPRGGDRGAGRRAARQGAGGLALGIAALDRMLGGGFALGGLHEITPAAPPDFGAAVSFALALLARALAAEAAGDSLAPEVRERADVPPESTAERSRAGAPPVLAGRQNPRNEFLNPFDIRAGRAVLWIEPEAAAFEGARYTGRGSNCSAFRWRA